MADTQIIAVTGSEGFVGRHVVRVLRAAGRDVVGFDRQGSNGVHLDRDLFTLDGCEAVIHCAAHADVRDNWNENGLRCIKRDNIDAMLCVLDAARKAPTVRTFVFVSSGAVYAAADGYTSDRRHYPARSPYAASKLAGEAYVEAYAHKHGWRWAIVRPAAAFGTGYHHGHVADFVRQARETGKIHALDRGVAKPALHVEDLAEHLASIATADPLCASGVAGMSGGVWSWRDTAALMGVEPTCDDAEIGWVGDSRTAYWPVSRGRPIADGVRDALTSLGWPS